MVQPVLIGGGLGGGLGVRGFGPATVDRRCLVCEFQCDLCDAGFVGCTRGRLRGRVDGHKRESSSVCGHYMSEHSSSVPPFLSGQFRVLTKCSNKFGCLIGGMLFIGGL